jgi:GDPmannose 4,6-dehydratase
MTGASCSTVLIFGVSGQDGHYLSQLCVREGYEVIGVSRSESSVIGDVANRSFVETLIKKHLPAFIFHLAARSSTRHDATFENHATIATGTLNILESVYLFSPETRVFLAGSGLQFVNRGYPICENTSFGESSSYAVMRNYSATLARYFRGLGILVYFGYLFHHESPRRKLGHLSKIIADGARRAMQGERISIEIGDLSVEKEWTFAGDTVSAIWLFVNQRTIFEINIGSGIAYSVADWANACFLAVGKDWREFVVQSQMPFRPEYQRLICDPSRIKSLGWSPKVALEKLSEMMVCDQ